MQQEIATEINANRILRGLSREIKDRGYVCEYGFDTLKIENVAFKLSKAPSDMGNGIIYLVAPHTQLIPIKEENICESVDILLEYMDNTVIKSNFASIVKYQRYNRIY